LNGLACRVADEFVISTKALRDVQKGTGNLQVLLKVRKKMNRSFQDLNFEPE